MKGEEYYSQFCKAAEKKNAWNSIQVLMNSLKFGVQTSLYATLPILGS